MIVVEYLFKYLARLALVANLDFKFDFFDRLRMFFIALSQTAVAIFVIDELTGWFDENKVFSLQLSVLILINAAVGARYHFKNGTFTVVDCILKNLEMVFYIWACFIAFDLFGSVVEDGIGTKSVRILFQALTMLYPLSKIAKNTFILTKGKFPSYFIMKNLYNFERNGDLRTFIKSFSGDSDNVKTDKDESDNFDTI